MHRTVTFDRKSVRSTNSPRDPIQPESVKQFQNLKTTDTPRLRIIHISR